MFKPTVRFLCQFLVVLSIYNILKFLCILKMLNKFILCLLQFDFLKQQSLKAVHTILIFFSLTAYLRETMHSSESQIFTLDFLQLYLSLKFPMGNDVNEPAQ